jgi:hypothetical protein
MMRSLTNYSFFQGKDGGGFSPIILSPRSGNSVIRIKDEDISFFIDSSPKIKYKFTYKREDRIAIAYHQG